MKPYLKQLRRASQLLCLGVFLILFRLTDYFGQDTIPYAVNILFRMDPLVAAAVTMAQRAWDAIFWPSLIVLGFTIVFGRVFCGWICPLGTLIDILTRFVPKTGKRVRMGAAKYILLTIVLASSLFGIQLLGFADPFSLLVRGMVFSIDPMLKYIVSLVFDTVYASGPVWLSDITEPVYDFLKEFALPYKQSVFYLSLMSFILLVTIILMDVFGRRFWCRNLCPLGGLLGLVSKIALFKRIPVKKCRHCGLCESDCRMDIFDSRDRFKMDECTLCMDCLEYCPDSITTFRVGSPLKGNSSLDIGRRQVLAAGMAGITVPVLLKTNALSQQVHEGVIRPPGALPEIEFSAACVRCGECMKVCINNALQPLFLEKGLEGMFTPTLVPRLGYCEFNCTLCSQVCPTGAIEVLSREKKHGFVIGKAVLDKNKCIVYADKKGCIVCEEHCPTHDKAIKFVKKDDSDFKGNAIQLHQPYVVEKLCIGCGICEHICPVQGEAAIRVIAKDDRKIEGIY